ncbi:MAG: PilZ domain-containing protein [Proteobacteria bacterium]|nr:PilZ domain-containing protein [Pseudomonadota bacterium]
MIPHLIEAFLIIPQPRQRLAYWFEVLAGLDTVAAPPLAMVTGYYDPNADEALIGLRYDPLALGDEHLSYVIEVALLAEIGMVQPAELSEGDRRRFVGDRLSRCTLQIDNQRSVIGVLGEVVRLVREARATQVARPLVPLVVPARGTRDDVRQPITARGTRDEVALRDSPPPPKRRLGTADIVDADADTERRPITTPPAMAPFVPSSPVPGVIYARYLRSGHWVPIRIGALSLKGASLLTGALPRMRDHVDVALTFGAHRALIRGTVSKLSTNQEAHASGASLFTVDFELDDVARRQLTSLLTAARAANITIKPPPPRATRRFPVEWPVCLGTSRGAVRGHALDVSQDGMFVRPANALALDSSLSFSAVLDDGQAPISGRARVVRHITEATARTAGLAVGYGLHFLETSEVDRLRWLRFMARVEQRAEKRVLIGASPARLAELQATLAALGYAVTGGTDPGALVQLARGEDRPVDAALIDASWLTPSVTTSWVESLFSARDVPCLTLHGDPRGARQAVDKLLLVT